MKFISYICLAAGLSSILFSVASASDGVAFDSVYARELAALNSLREGLDQQIEQLRKAHESRINEKNIQLKSLDLKLVELAVQIDDVQTRLDENEKKAKVAGNGGSIDLAAKDLRKTIEAYEGRLRRTVISSDAMRGFRDEVSEAGKILRRAGQVREEAGAFKMRDGALTQGALIWFGETSVVGKSALGLVPLGPDGNGGWLALETPIKDKPLTRFAFFSDLRSKADASMAATGADRLAGLIPIFWLGILGAAVGWLFVSIAKQ